MAFLAVIGANVMTAQRLKHDDRKWSGGVGRNSSAVANVHRPRTELTYKLHLAPVVGWIGMIKFTAYEAQGIEPLVAHSPLLGWMYRIWTVRQFSDGLLVVGVAILIAL